MFPVPDTQLPAPDVRNGHYRANTVSKFRTTVAALGDTKSDEGLIDSGATHPFFSLQVFLLDVFANCWGASPSRIRNHNALRKGSCLVTAKWWDSIGSVSCAKIHKQHPGRKHPCRLLRYNAHLQLRRCCWEQVYRYPKGYEANCIWNTEPKRFVHCFAREKQRA